MLGETETQLTFTTQMQIIKHPNIMIGDTGATTTSMFSSVSATNMRAGDTADAMQGSHGDAVQPSGLMDVPGVWCDKFGNEYQPATIKDVLHAPNQNFNMFSISKALMSGWMLSGDREGIVLTKGDATIRFDIMIDTRRGALFCGYFKRGQEVSAGSTESGAFSCAAGSTAEGHDQALRNQP